MRDNKNYLSADDVAEELEISKSHAYKVIRQFNKELSNMGYFVIEGKVDRNYFIKRTRYHEEDTK